MDGPQTEVWEEDIHESALVEYHDFLPVEDFQVDEELRSGYDAEQLKLTVAKQKNFANEDVVGIAIASEVGDDMSDVPTDEAGTRHRARKHGPQLRYTAGKRLAIRKPLLKSQAHAYKRQPQQFFDERRKGFAVTLGLHWPSTGYIPSKERWSCTHEIN